MNILKFKKPIEIWMIEAECKRLAFKMKFTNDIDADIKIKIATDYRLRFSYLDKYIIATLDKSDYYMSLDDFSERILIPFLHALMSKFEKQETDD